MDHEDVEPKEAKIKPWHIVVAFIFIIGMITTIFGEQQRLKEERLQRTTSARILKNIEQAKRQNFLYYARAAKIINLDLTLWRIIDGYKNFYGNPYVSIYRAENYEDSVVVSIVWPSVRAYQIVFNPDSPPKYLLNPETEISPSQIPESVKNWNCSIVKGGMIVVKGFEKASLPTIEELRSKNGYSDQTTDSNSKSDEGNDWQANEKKPKDNYKNQEMYLVILASEKTKEAAEDKIREIDPLLGDVENTFVVDESSHYEGLKPGYWIVIQGYTSKQSALYGAAFVVRGDFDPYIKKVIKRCSDDLDVSS